MKTFKQFLYECYIILEKKEEEEYDDSNSPEARALLDAIAGSESPGYNVTVGGSKFDDLSQHPGSKDKSLYKRTGFNSDASGRYQFLSTTYEPIAKQLGLKDFSPRSQDRAAWQLAKQTYGGDIKKALRDDPVGVANRLSGQWTSLPGGSQRNSATDAFEKRFKESLARYQGGLQQSSSTPTSKPTPAPEPTPAPTTVLAKLKGKTGVLDKATGKFTEKDWEQPEVSRYAAYGGK